MSESLKTVLNEWRPINGESGEVAYEDRIKALEAENTRLLDIVQREPAACYLEAVQRACDERLTHLKHAEREARARAEEAERQLTETRMALEKLRSYAASVWFDEANASDEEREVMRYAHAALAQGKQDDIANLERQLARAREALEWYARCDIAAKSVADGSTCRMEHDDGARARAALQDIAATSGKE